MFWAEGSASAKALGRPIAAMARWPVWLEQNREFT